MLQALKEKAEKVAGRKMVVFKQLIQDLLEHAPQGIRFQLLCDDEQDLAPEVYKFYTRTKVQDSEARERLIGVAFMDDRYLPQVQLADMCAYFGRVETRSSVSTTNRTPTSGYCKTHRTQSGAGQRYCRRANRR